MQPKAILLNEEVVGRTLKRLSYEIVEKSDELSEIVLIGIRTRGVPLAKIIADNIQQAFGMKIPLGELDISLYRDDLSAVADRPVVNSTKIDCDVTGKDVVLVDDVIFTGRTVRAAIDAVLAIGRPRRIRLAVLVDRGHRELPIRADYVGKNVPTSLKELVAVHLTETDGRTDVELLEL